MRRKTLTLVSVVVLIAAGVLLLHRRFSGSAINLRPSVAVGEVLADETVRLLGGSGKVVVVGRAVVRDGQSAASEQLASFNSAIVRRGSPTVVATEWLPRPAPLTMNAGDVTTDRLLQIVEKNPEADALILFAGLPPFSPALAQKLEGRPVKLLAVCGYSPNVRRWLAARALAVAVVPRFGELPSGAPAPKTAKEWFSQEYELLTPQRVGELPY
jgi:hypothetical protein